MEAQALDRSKLEQKDRAELAAIVEAMGGKATSRAKKADLVDQIMQLAGVGGADEDGGSPDDADEAGEVGAAPGEAEVEAPRDADTGPSLPEPGVTIPDGAVGSDEEPLAEWERDVEGDAEPTGGRRNAAGRGGQQPGQGQSRPGGQGGSGGQGQGGQGQGGQGQGGPQAGQGDDGEPGNRRRRRRGRDRGRDRDGAPEAGASPATADDVVGDPVDVEGYLDLRDEGYGFLRVHGYLPSKDDVYVSVKQVRQLSLRKGDHVQGACRPASRNEKNPALLRIDAVNGGDPDAARSRRRFEELTPVFPDEHLQLERAGAEDRTGRVVDLLAPIGKGQRGLLVAPPRSGRTTVLKQLAVAVEAAHPDVHLIVLLVDERPEEVTDFRRSLERGEVAASTFDRPAEEHTQVAELTVERAKRMVEEGRDVVLVLDGLTRLARAYNLAHPGGGKVVPGGIDAAALHPTKKVFAAARRCEEGGSLTIVATALVGTGSAADEAVVEELRSAANMQLVLDRRLADLRVFPAVDVEASSTRHDELLFEDVEAAQGLRRALAALAAESGPVAAAERLDERLRASKTNADLLAAVAKGGL